MHVVPLTARGFGYAVIGWYFYGLGYNTCQTPCQTSEEAKAEAMKHYKNWKKGEPDGKTK
jgi:hypothetical protein